MKAPRLKSCLYPGVLEVGCDEAGRGCLAGPVFAAAVVLPKGIHLKGLNDSKKLTLNQRKKLRAEIEKKAVCFKVAMVSPNEIDEINILNASFKAMHLAIDGLSLSPQFILVDGNRFMPYQDLPHECIIKGDSKFKSIAAASILAKTYRDEFMENLHANYPNYAWEKNKGYPTLEHRMAIIEHGLSPHHRKTFKHSIQGKLF